MNLSTPPHPSLILTRHRLLSLAHTALAVGETRYARRLTLSWLAAFPGDLPVGLIYARALRQENLASQAVSALEGLCLADPEYLEAQEALANLAAASEAGAAGAGAAGAGAAGAGAAGAGAAGAAVALGGKVNSEVAAPPWAESLRQARRALALGDLAAAEALLFDLLQDDPPTPLAAITHLQILAAHHPPAPALALRNLSQTYHQRWPGCVQFTLFLADSLMDLGDHEHAVALLHQAATQDVTGQVAARLWGKDHPYRSLWPQKLESGAYGPTPPQSLPIPAGVATALGWNQLPAPSAPAPSAPAPSAPAPVLPPDETPTPKNPAPPPKALSESLLSVQNELERLADGLHQPQLAKTDGRFPAYVIFSTRRGLEAQYGPEAVDTLQIALKRFANSVRARHRWDVVTLFADDPKNAAALGIAPEAHTDAWGLKRSLNDLDNALGRRGERIGAVCIVGGPRVVPFHRLPNPVDDADADVPSDNPYTTRDENYFIPEWPVGRIPGDDSRSVQPLLHALEHLTAANLAQAQRKPLWQRGWQALRKWLGKNRQPASRSLGYTAAIWRRASLAVYRAIGEPRSLHVSPPVEAGALRFDFEPRMGYFNLHGIPDAVEWYGQRDPTEPGNAPDYPVALRPQDVQNSGHSPQVVFSEACYGAHIFDKSVEQALALKFLACGSQAVVGSTSVAYGSISMPLIAADLLGRLFWAAQQEGLPAGEALRRAKIGLAREMHQRQGYLDGEDQKTLIAFVLYGDPLGGMPADSKGAAAPKTALRTAGSAYIVKTICDRGDEANPVQPISPEVMAHVKHVVAQYLPGMADASVKLTTERAECAAGHTCPTSQMGAKSRPAQNPARKVVTLSKQIQTGAQGGMAVQHHQYARLTLDREGKLVKLVVSR
jgi:hypothetical protein